VQIAFEITYNDGSASDTAIASVADQVAFERTFDRSIANLSSDFRLTDMCWLAWSGLRRKKNIPDFDEWLGAVAGVEVKEAGVTPLETNQPTG
jgi:hypothetical protein